MSRKGIFLGNFLFSAFNYSLYLLMGLLISALGTSLSAGGPGSLLGASACGVSPAPYSRRSLRAFRRNQQGGNQLKELQHTFSSLANCVAIFFIFWQAAVRRASLASSIPVTGNSEARAALLSLRSFAQFFPF
ncbi:hypothetical protein QF028_000618 [Neobacillus sp. B4I6]